MLFVVSEWISVWWSGSGVRNPYECKDTNDQYIYNKYRYTFIGNITDVIGHSIHVNFTLNLVQCYINVFTQKELNSGDNSILFALLSSVH